VYVDIVMNNLVWCNRLALVVLFLGVIVLGFAIALQPKISDEWYLIWNYEDSKTVVNFIVLEYTKWMGRGWGILLAAFVLPNPVVTIVYRFFIVFEILLLIAIAWYCALGSGSWSRNRENYQKLAIFGSL